MVLMNDRNDRRREAVMMRLDGKTFEEIGKVLGVTKQAAYAMVSHAMAGRKRIRNPENYFYGNLVKHISDNYRSVRAFAVENDINYQTLMNMLRKRHEPNWKTICKLRECTGLTVEELMVK